MRDKERFDLALLDPPYEFDGWSDLLGELPADFAVIESNREVDLPEGWESVRTRTYGSTVVLFARNVRGPAPE
jgi:16S rRNA G966 N2-methylase RsmD